MLNTSVICLLNWLIDKFLTISLNILANSCGQLPTVSVMQLYQKGLLGNLLKMPRNPWPFTDKTWTIYQEYWQIFGQLCREILGNLPRILTNSWPVAEKSRTICRETLDHLPRVLMNSRLSAKIAEDHLLRMPTNPWPSAEIAKNCHWIMLAKNAESNPWLALAAGLFGSLGSW